MNIGKRVAKLESALTHKKDEAATVQIRQVVVRSRADVEVARLLGLLDPPQPTGRTPRPIDRVVVTAVGLNELNELNKPRGNKK